DAVAALADAHPAVHKLLRRFSDVERITGRVALRNARPRDLSSLRDSLALLPELPPAIPGSAPLLVKLQGDLEVPHECLALLRRSVMDEPSAMVRDGGVIADGYSRSSTSCARCRPTPGPSSRRSNPASASAPASPTCASRTTTCTASTSRSPT